MAVFKQKKRIDIALFWFCSVVWVWYLLSYPENYRFVQILLERLQCFGNPYCWTVHVRSLWTAITSRVDISFIKRLYVTVGNKHNWNSTKCTLQCVTCFLWSIIQLSVLLNPSTSQDGQVKGGLFTHIVKIPPYWPPSTRKGEEVLHLSWD